MKAETVESVLAGIRGPVERGWRNEVVQYVPATDDEKAAALDAAIEFEDAFDVDRIDFIDDGAGASHAFGRAGSYPMSFGSAVDGVDVALRVRYPGFGTAAASPAAAETETKVRTADAVLVGDDGVGQ